MRSDTEFSDNYAESGRRIAARRRALELTQAALAEMVGVAQSSLADWERGKTRPRPLALRRLGRALKMDPYEFLPEAGLDYSRSVFSHKIADDAERTQDNAPYGQVVQHIGEQESEDQLYLMLYDAITAFIDEMYSSDEAKSADEIWFAGSSSPAGSDKSRRRQAVLLTKRLWSDALAVPGETAMAEKVLYALDSYRNMMRSTLKIQRLTREVGKTD